MKSEYQRDRISFDRTTENLLKTHNSRPYNPDLANTFFRAGYIESKRLKRAKEGD